MPQDHMPIYDTKPAPSAPVAVHQADGFLVSFEYRTALGTIKSHDYFERLEGEEGALEAYENPGKYIALGISACKGGVPFAALDMATIHSVAREVRQDARDDAEHVRLSSHFGRASL